MSKSTQDKLDLLNSLMANESGEVAVLTLRKALKERSNFLVGKAAEWVSEKLLYELIDDLLAAYHRFLDDPFKKDKTCRAKRALAKALYDLDCNDVKFYQAGIVYYQLEPGYGSAVDTSIDVRNVCALGLMAFGGMDALLEVVALLGDVEPHARLGAVKAIALAQPFYVELILRQKIMHGDESAEVISECFSSLMHVEAERSLDFVADYLRHNDETLSQAAAWSLGESRLDEAMDLLIAASEKIFITSSLEYSLFESIAMQRKNRATDYLITNVEQSATNRSCNALKALSLFDYDDELRARLQLVIAARSNERITTCFKLHWGA